MQKNVIHHLCSLHRCSALQVSEREHVGLLPDLHKKIVTKMALKFCFFKSRILKCVLYPFKGWESCILCSIKKMTSPLHSWRSFSFLWYCGSFYFVWQKYHIFSWWAGMPSLPEQLPALSTDLHRELQQAPAAGSAAARADGVSISELKVPTE